MTYQEYRQKKQEEFNALPLFFAFSDEQFKEAMEERGLTVNDTDKIYRLGLNSFYLRSDSRKILDFVNKPDELSELMKDRDFAISAFRYEMDNHEYAINYYQGDWDVISCFTSKRLEFSDDKNYKDYLYDAGLEDLIPEYQIARAAHMKAAEDWF